MDINGLSSLSPLITLFFQPLNWDEPLITKMWASNISPKGWMEKNLIWDHFLYLRWRKTAPQTWGPSLAEPQLFKCSPEVLPSFWWLNPKRIALLHNFDRSIPTVPRVFIIFLGEPRFFLGWFDQTWERIKHSSMPFASKKPRDPSTKPPLGGIGWKSCNQQSPFT